MKRLFLLLSLLFVFSVSGFADSPLDNCSVAVYHVPPGEPFSSKVVRPSFWEVWRWDCLNMPMAETEFENSPANQTDYDFQLAIPVQSTNGTVYYPILYVNDRLTIYKNGEVVGVNDAYVTQGTGIVHFINAPDLGDVITFDIMLDLEGDS